MVMTLPGFKKYLFYITFASLGSFCAEVISTNYPLALLNPFIYLAYGLLYIFFIDALMRWKERNFYIMFLFGSLVGLITETYVTKVTFYGLKPDESRIFGISPGAILFIILFYHAFFSFLMPLYLAKRILSVPLQISRKKPIDFLFIIIPFFLLPAVYNQLVSRQWNVLFLIGTMGISAAVLFLWILLLRYTGEIKNILLSEKERKGLLIFTVIIYVIFLLTGTNEAHGHKAMDFPPVPMMVISVIIIVILLLIFKVIGKNREPEKEISYSPASINFPLFFLWIFWHFSVTATFLIFQKVTGHFLLTGLPVLAVTGLILAIISFILSLFYLIKSLLRP